MAATQTTLPESSRTQIPVQMVGVDGDPYQTRMLPLQTGFPDKMGERVYYEPVNRGLEIKLKEKLDALREARSKARGKK